MSYYDPTPSEPTPSEILDNGTIVNPPPPPEPDISTIFDNDVTNPVYN